MKSRAVRRDLNGKLEISSYKSRFYILSGGNLISEVEISHFKWRTQVIRDYGDLLSRTISRDLELQREISRCVMFRMYIML